MEKRLGLAAPPRLSRAVGGDVCEQRRFVDAENRNGLADLSSNRLTSMAWHGRFCIRLHNGRLASRRWCYCGSARPSLAADLDEHRMCSTRIGSCFVVLRWRIARLAYHHGVCVRRDCSSGDGSRKHFIVACTGGRVRRTQRNRLELATIQSLPRSWTCNWGSDTYLSWGRVELRNQRGQFSCAGRCVHADSYRASSTSRKASAREKSFRRTPIHPGPNRSHSHVGARRGNCIARRSRRELVTRSGQRRVWTAGEQLFVSANLLRSRCGRGGSVQHPFWSARLGIMGNPSCVCHCRYLPSRGAV